MNPLQVCRGMSKGMPSTSTTTAAGPRDVSAHLAQRHRSGLLRYLRVIGCADDLAEDLVQEALLVVVRRAGFADRGYAATAAFLQRTVRHLYLKALRRPAAVREVEEADRVWHEECGADGGDGWLEALRACLAQLPQRSRELLAATYGEDLGRRDLALRFSLTEDGVKTALRRLRAALRECVERRRMP